jgi:hypothetical protein
MLPGVAALALLCILPLPCHAQGFGGGELERSLRPGPYTPYDGAGFSHRYNYEFGPIFYPGYNSSRWAYLEYLDRLERLEHFGHRWPSSRFGRQYQIQRIENEYWRHWNSR